MRVFVTGSTGLLGNNLVRALLAQGHEVLALVRSKEKAQRHLGDTKARLILGDMSDVSGFAEALTGVDWVFHTAAYFREYYAPGDHREIIDRINVTATIALARAAHERGVKKMIDTSSSSIIGLSADKRPGTEETPPSYLVRSNLYAQSKLKAERELRALSQESGFFIASVLPGWMWGPLDAGPTAAGQLILDFLGDKLPGIPPGGTIMVDARDVAKAMIQIAQKGRAERYIIGGRYLSLAEVVQLLSQVSGKPAPRWKIPYAVALMAAAGAQLWSRLTRTPTVMSIEGIRLMNARLNASSAKAERELGVTFRPFEETLRDSLQWISSQK